MILPIQKSNFINKPNIIPTDKNCTVAQEQTSCTDKSLLPVAYYLPVNFSARITENCSTPVETTQNYIPKTKSADHLNLPDIHVFEYPDTNLRVFINTPKVQEQDEKQKIAVKLCISPNNDNINYINNFIIIDLINKQLKKTNLNFTISENKAGLYTINGIINTADMSQIQALNKIIKNPDFTKNEFENSKAKLTNLLGEKFKINKLTLTEVQNYYSETLNNSNTKYFITLDQELFKHQKEQLFKLINSNLPEFSYTTNIQHPKFVPNTEVKIKEQTTNAPSNIQILYPFDSNSIKESLIALFTSLVITMCKSDDFECETDIIQQSLIDKIKSKNNYFYHQLKFSSGHENIPETEKDFLKKFTSNDKITNEVLNVIKNYYKELAENDLKSSSVTTANNALYSYDYECFNINELIDSITSKDIETHINTYMLEQKPIIIK